MIMISAEYADVDVCQDLDDGTFLADSNNCQNFFICDGGRAWKMYCPGSLLWNDHEGTCDYAQNVECYQPE